MKGPDALCDEISGRWERMGRNAAWKSKEKRSEGGYGSSGRVPAYQA
jgi:hypothetical protein